MTTPARVLDLSLWKVTLPIGSPGRPLEIKQPTLAKFTDPLYFAPVDRGVRFRAPVTGVTTSGSSNPRSELREMNRDGSNASWSSSKGSHVLTVVEAFTHLPNPRTDGGNAGVVGAQIHDSENDISVFRLEDTKLYVTKGNTTHHALADGNYQLGTRFEAKFIVWKDEVKAYYNGKLITTIKGKFSGAYFKAGCYTQANKNNSLPVNDTNYGEVIISSVIVSHTTNPPSEPVPVPVVPSPPPVVVEPPPLPPIDPIPAPPPEPPPSPVDPIPSQPAPPDPVPAPPVKRSWWERFLAWLSGTN